MISQISKKRGFTLIEAMAVIALIIVIFIPAYGLYNLGQRSYRDVSDKQEILQNGRVILDRLSREIRQAAKGPYYWVDGEATKFPETPEDAVDEIEFQDGHLVQIQQSDTARDGSANTIKLAEAASDEDDYYNEMFIKIIEGPGIDQIRKIIDYEGATRVAWIQNKWDTEPESGSTYQVGSRYYYLYYFRDKDNPIPEYQNDFRRQVKVYCCTPEEDEDCSNSDVYVPWNVDCGEGELNESVLEDELIGEYVTGIDFWGTTLINIRINLAKNDKTLQLSTQLLGRNMQ